MVTFIDDAPSAPWAACTVSSAAILPVRLMRALSVATPAAVGPTAPALLLLLLPCSVPATAAVVAARLVSALENCWAWGRREATQGVKRCTR